MPHHVVIPSESVSISVSRLEAQVHMQARHQRVKAKAQQARAARQAATLRKFWLTHSGVTWQDALLTGSMLGLGYYWAPKKATPPMAKQDSTSGGCSVPTAATQQQL